MPAHAKVFLHRGLSMRGFDSLEFPAKRLTMAQPPALKRIDALTGMDARLQALDKLEGLVDEVVAQKARHRSNQYLKRAVRIWRKGDIVRSGQWALKASEADESNPKA